MILRNSEICLASKGLVATAFKTFIKEVPREKQPHGRMGREEQSFAPDNQRMDCVPLHLWGERRCSGERDRVERGAGEREGLNEWAEEERLCVRRRVERV